MSASRSIGTVLVPQRGEIALRIIRTLRRLGIRTCLACSEIDRVSLPARRADEVLVLGGASPAESYLSIERILDAAARTGADAIHPGYGFLSERADFAEAVESAGIVFLGPTPEQVRQLGDKLEARRLMEAAGVGPVPGSREPLRDERAAREISKTTGFPLLLKAAAGGGGKGIRIVREASELDAAFRQAASEAESAFGCGDLFCERFIEGGRHIEVQMLGDGQGGVRLFYERDCSLQRRLQKLVEETPCPRLPAGVRERILRASLELARRTRYRGPGTVEFLLEPGGDVHFLEVNTRIQVEHPITEETAGVDLVEMQVDVARGERLPGRELEDVVIEPRGAAIEVRLNAEDPCREFRPGLGGVSGLWWPQAAGLRVDSSLMVGDEVTPWYDALVAKVIASGPDRETAIGRLRQALAETVLTGISTTLPLAVAVLDDAEFRAGAYDCQSLERMVARPGFLDASPELPDDTRRAVLAAMAWKKHRESARTTRLMPAPAISAWRRSPPPIDGGLL